MALRIGEQLVRDALVTRADLEDALALARARGLRLVSALVTLGRVTADDGARALAEQHGVPAALTKHLAGRDPELASLLTAGLARTLAALPLAVSRGRDALVVCVRDPGPLATAALERALTRPIVLAVAVESLLLPLVAEAYPLVSDEADGFDIDVETDPHDAASADGFDPAALQLVELDDRGVSRDLSQISGALGMTGSGSAMGDGLAAAIDAPAPARPASSPFAAIAPPAPAGFGLEAARGQLDLARTGDQVLEALRGLLRHRFEVGVVFVIRDGLALGQVGFGNDVRDDAIGALVVPLSQPSVLRIAHDQAAPYVGAPIGTSVVQERFLRLFGAPPSRLAVVPVTIKDRVVNLLYAQRPRTTSIEDAAAELGTLARAAEAALVRIILQARST